MDVLTKGHKIYSNFPKLYKKNIKITRYSLRCIKIYLRKQRNPFNYNNSRLKPGVGFTFICFRATRTLNRRFIPIPVYAGRKSETRRFSCFANVRSLKYSLRGRSPLLVNWIRDRRRLRYRCAGFIAIKQRFYGVIKLFKCFYVCG